MPDRALGLRWQLAPHMPTALLHTPNHHYSPNWTQRVLTTPPCTLCRHAPSGQDIQMPDKFGLRDLWDVPSLNVTIFAEIAVDQVGLGGDGGSGAGRP